MEEINFDIVNLLKKHLLSGLSGEEMRQMEEWLREDEEHQLMYEEIRDKSAWKQREEIYARIQLQEALQHFDKQVKYRQILYWIKQRGKYAAVIIPLLLLPFIFWPEKQKKEEVQIMPGTSLASLSIGGKTISLRTEETQEYVLDSLKTRINSEAGVLSLITEKEVGAEIYASLTTPFGGEYVAILSDSTKVYLNAGSELRYPLVFHGDIREVFLSGEAFFEVKKIKNRPFIVSCADTKVEVLGTSFGVTSYPEESRSRTVLESGVVRFVANGSARLLAPGQLAEYNRESAVITVKEVDPKYFTAWRHGQFFFDNTSLLEITTLLGRWYDIEFNYTDDTLKKLKFSGVALRFKPLDFTLSILEQTCAVTFRQTGKQTIMISHK